MTDSTQLDESLVSEETPTEKIWSDGFILLLHIILPIAITGIIIGRKVIFAKILAQLDKSCISIFCPSYSKQEKLKKWMHNYIPYIEGGLSTIWKDGSVMCTLINSVVPGACPNPHRHWKKPPTHGQALAYKYLGVIPVFSESDFARLKPTAAQEKLLLDYVSNLQTAIDKLTPNQDLTFSTIYVARGMGLMTGEQHRRTVIYIYSNFRTGQTMEDLLINIRGPYNTFGSAIVEAREFSRNSNTSTPDKRQRSFLKSISTDFSNLLKPKDKGPACDIEIRIDFEQDRAKLIFVPNNSGVYEICMTTNGEHIAGSPYNLNIEKNRTGITECLAEEDTKRVDSKTLKRKVANTVIYYEKLRSQNGSLVTSGKNSEEKCQILNLVEGIIPEEYNTDVDVLQDTVKNSEGVGSAEETLPLLQTVEELNSLLESNSKVLVNDKRENFGLNIIDTLRDIPELKKISENNFSLSVPHTGLNVNNDIKSEDHTKISETITEAGFTVPDIEEQTNDCDTLQNDLCFTSFVRFNQIIEENPNSEQNDCDQTDKKCTADSDMSTEEEKLLSTDIAIADKKPVLLTSFKTAAEQKSQNQFDQTYNYLSLPEEQNQSQHQQETPILQYDNSSLFSENTDAFQCTKSCLVDSGTYVNEDIDPDSLTSSVDMEPLQGSSEEISSGTGSDDHEVNNNDIMVKSNEDICYLILNQSSDNCRKRVYSKDFISCKDDKSKDDLSKSDPNLHHDIVKPNRSQTSESVIASGLSQDSVQEASIRMRTNASRMLKQHAQEDSRIAGTRSHSYSHGSLLETENVQDGTGRDGGLEFKKHFLQRKAFWTNISRSSVSLSDRLSSNKFGESKSISSCNMLQNGGLSQNINIIHKPNVEKIALKTESIRSIKNVELRSRSLDYVRQRRKTFGYENLTTEGAKYGSVDDLNFPSLQQRKELYLKEQKNTGKLIDKDKDLYAVRGDKCASSIHDKIKCFETPTTVSMTPAERLATLPENITITTKIKERFERAQTYFKDLENKTSDEHIDKRRYSFDGDLNSTSQDEKLSSLRLEANFNENDNRNDKKDKVKRKLREGYRNTISSMQSNTIDTLNARNHDKELQLQMLLNEGKKKMKERKTATDVFT